jgi:hypothetical protein
MKQGPSINPFTDPKYAKKAGVVVFKTNQSGFYGHVATPKVKWTNMFPGPKTPPDDPFDKGHFMQYLVHADCLEWLLAVIRVALCPYIALDVRVAESYWCDGRIRVLVEEEWTANANPFFEHQCAIKRIASAVRHTGLESQGSLITLMPGRMLGFEYELTHFAKGTITPED